MPPEELSNVNHKSEQITHLLYPPLNDKEAAEYLGVAVQTLRNWRHLGRGPEYLKLAPGPRGRVVYEISGLERFKNQCRIKPGLN